MSDPSTLQDAVAVKAIPGDRALARWGETEVLLVTSASAAGERELAEQVARRAMRDTPFHSPAYTAGEDGDIRVFIARERGLAVGLVVLRLRPRWAWWSWDDWDAERRPSTGVAPIPSWTVETVWVHGASQGRSLARQILDVASVHVGQPITSFGWHRPFTPSGEAFVRRCCPEGFWVPD